MFLPFPSRSTTYSRAPTPVVLSRIICFFNIIQTPSPPAGGSSPELILDLEFLNPSAALVPFAKGDIYWVRGFLHLIMFSRNSNYTNLLPLLKPTHFSNVPFFSKGTSVAEGFGVVLYFSYIFFPLHLTPHLICNSFWLFCHGLQNRVSGG